MRDIKFWIKNFIIKKTNLREFVYTMYPLNEDFPKIIKYVITHDGLKILPLGLFTWNNIFMEYQFEDIKKDDIVLDVGANIGAFALRAAKLSHNIHAIEPLWTDKLQENINLNPELAKYITIHEIAIGNGEKVSIEYDNREKIIETIRLKDLIKDIGGCDFLKMDIEGFELIIPHSDFLGIPRIELEYHEHDKASFKPNNLEIFLKSNWNCHVNEKIIEKGRYFHCYPLRA